MKKVAATIGIVVLAMTAGCANAEQLTLSVSYSSGAYSNVMLESARRFEMMHPNIKIEYRMPVLNTYDELLQSTLRSALVGDLADVSLEGSQNVGILARRRIPIALDDLIRSEPDWTRLGYSPSITDVGDFQGKTYALAYAVSVPTIYYNLDLTKEAGIDAENLPADWSGIISLSTKIKTLRKDVVGGLFDYHSAGNWTFQALITSQGASILSADGSEITLDKPQVLRSLEILRDFGRAGTVDMTQSQMLQAFAAGTVGVFASFSAAIGQIEKQIAGKFTLKAAPFPAMSRDGRVPAGGRVALIYAKDPRKQKAAWEFIKFLTGPVGQTILVKGVGAVPVNELAVTDKTLLGSFYDQNPNQKATLESVPRLTKWLPYPGDSAIKIGEVVRNQLRRVLISHDEPSVVLVDMKKAIEPLLPTKQ
jgi:multiple sugar transport system substrate-binding protein